MCISLPIYIYIYIYICIGAPNVVLAARHEESGYVRGWCIAGVRLLRGLSCFRISFGEHLFNCLLRVIVCCAYNISRKASQPPTCLTLPIHHPLIHTSKHIHYASLVQGHRRRDAKGVAHRGKRRSRGKDEPRAF